MIQSHAGTFTVYEWRLENLENMTSVGECMTSLSQVDGGWWQLCRLGLLMAGNAWCISTNFPTTRNFQHTLYNKLQSNPTKKLRLNNLALAFQYPRPGQSHHEAILMARLGLAYLGLAWPSSWPQAGPSTPLSLTWVSFFSYVLSYDIICSSYSSVRLLIKTCS
jgi:hypothetical protein